jgi:hypothetical protein
VRGDARHFQLDREFALVLAPMQLIQLLGDAGERISCLRSAGAHLRAGGLAALAIVEEVPAPEEAGPPLPDAREIDGWLYSSLPLDARLAAGAIQIRRLRQTVSPAGRLSDEVSEIRLRPLSAKLVEDEAEAAGLRPAGRREIASTDAHVGSTVILVERET